MKNEINDSIHLAVATLAKLDAIVSWNFKHLVNIDTIEHINSINTKRGLSSIQILSPVNIGGHKYGNY